MLEGVQSNSGQYERHRSETTSNQISDYDSLLMFPLTEDGPDNNKAKHEQRQQGRFRSWGWEISACLLSLVSFSAIIVVLAIEDGKPLDQWAWGIGPTAVVSFITTIAKSSMLLAAAEIIGQLKWHHFHTGTRPVIDLQTFDSAGRGPLGASKLLWKNHVKTSLASLVAVVVILSLLVDPFMQLVFTFPTRSQLDTSFMGFLNSTQVYDPNGHSYNPTHYGPSSTNPRMQLAIITAAGDQPIQHAGECTAGNCTWPSITTLGVCSDCTNVTLQTDVECGARTSANLFKCDYSFPSGRNLSGIGFAPGGAGPMQPTRWNSSSDIPPFVVSPDTGSVAALTSFRAIQIAAGDNVQSLLRRPVAWECALTLCENKYENVAAINGLISLPKPRQEDLFISGRVANNYELIKKNSSSPNTTYKINAQDYVSLAIYLTELFSWSWIDNGVRVGDNNGATSPNLGWQFADAKDFGHTVSNIATSMTEAIRNSRNSTSVSTYASRTRTYIEVQWGWIVLPLTLTVLNTLLVAFMVIKRTQSNIPIWKNSTLALLLYDVPGWTPTTRILNGTSTLEKEAENVSVTLSANIEDLEFIRK
ncbi:hypothetical protein F4803DRAFT_561858 [Xylaria telfairii]|nr:hypothetical protein F4803DRAFT_561858 [Xylaria telfairii]